MGRQGGGWRRAAAAVALATSVGLAGCTSEPDECSWNSAGRLDGAVVDVFAPYSGAVAEQFRRSVEAFTRCTGASVSMRAPAEKQSIGDAIGAAMRSGDTPDIAIAGTVFMAGLERDAMAAAPEDVVTALSEDYSAGWQQQMTLDGTVYGVPVDTEVKSLVWYSPRRFAQAGYEVPQTWEEMMTLTQRIADDTAADSAGYGVRPWCAGFASATDSGWPGTDWVEDAALRVMTPDDYDRWINHEVPFTSAQAVEAMQMVGAILKEPRYVNGGLGSVAGIAATYHLDAGRPIVDGSCYLHRQASFLSGHFGTAPVGPGQDVWAFPLPPVSEDVKPVIGTGQVAVALAARPEVQAFHTFLASSTWVNARAQVTDPNGTGWATPHRGVDLENIPREIDRLSTRMLTDDHAVFRYDGSDTMPPAVGRRTWFPQMLAWIRGGTDAGVLEAVERAWQAQ